MEQKYVSKRVTATILSMSLLTVMAGAAIAPALGIIKAHFSEANPLLVQLIVMPLSKALFSTDLTAPYKVSILFCLVFLMQVYATRHFQSLPPKAPDINIKSGES